MPNETLPITIRSKQRIEGELRKLLQEERPAVIKAIEEARAQGDLSENADYDAAKERQAWIEARISEIQNRLAGAEVIDPSTLNSERVVFGAYVALQDLETNEEVEYQIVGPEEADIKSGKLSILSPLGRSLIGKVKEDSVVVQTPKGEREFELVGISFR